MEKKHSQNPTQSVVHMCTILYGHVIIYTNICTSKCIVKLCKTYKIQCTEFFFTILNKKI